ncbi:MAG: cell division protein ZapE [Alphaproteobacteria bacterium]|nr:cell division protein ZapE [Alphaproteobacteria bacterium]
MTAPQSPDLISRYNQLVDSGQLRHDEGQLDAIGRLDNLRAFLETADKSQRSLIGALRERWYPDQPPSVYLWGGVGSGKSMLMDMFFAKTRIKHKRRVHFYAFMQEIHRDLHKARKKGTADPVASVAQAVAAKTRLLCFDELQITDITDAMLVGRLFELLIEAGVAVVTTSNRPPRDLYKDGLNRALFLPFIEFVQARFVVHHLVTDLDYRQDRLRGETTYFSPLDKAATDGLNRIWCDLTFGYGAPLCLTVNGRDVILPMFHNGVARASFAELCEAALGPADYLAIAGAIKVLVLENIPELSPSANNEAKRFVILIDTLYEAKIRLICSAAAPPEALFTNGRGAFEFQRTASRLSEMQSADWARPHELASLKQA